MIEVNRHPGAFADRAYANVTVIDVPTSRGIVATAADKSEHAFFRPIGAEVKPLGIGARSRPTYCALGYVSVSMLSEPQGLSRRAPENQPCVPVSMYFKYRARIMPCLADSQACATACVGRDVPVEKLLHAGSGWNICMIPLNEAFALQASGPGEWKAHAHPGYEANNGMFGGWTAAILLKSILDDTRVQGTPVALTAHYLKPVSPRSEVNIQTRSVGGSRSLNFWEAKLSLADHEEPAALAMIVLANRRASDGFTDQFMPNVPDPETLPEFHPPATFGERTLVRPVSGHPAFNQPNTRSIAWVRETSGRAVDFLQLAYLSDVYAPRIFMKSPGPRPSSTIAMSVYFHASETELHDVGDDYILTEATGTRAELSTVGSQARLWSRNRGLLATTEQLCWFK